MGGGRPGPAPGGRGVFGSDDPFGAGTPRGGGGVGPRRTAGRPGGGGIRGAVPERGGGRGRSRVRRGVGVPRTGAAVGRDGPGPVGVVGRVRHADGRVRAAAGRARRLVLAGSARRQGRVAAHGRDAARPVRGAGVACRGVALRGTGGVRRGGPLTGRDHRCL